MVFRGKLSKACERCRARRLKCDFRHGSCGQCIRANTPCAGYRDPFQLRICNESRSVARKVVTAARPAQYPLMSVDLHARDVFFAYYAGSNSSCWHFIQQYHHPLDTPELLTRSIEAISLAYLWHKVNSSDVLTAARSKYVSALRLTNAALSSPQDATRYTTLLAVILLDLFEKITCIRSHQEISWTSHVNGALTLAKLRGFDSFQQPSDLYVLICLTLHCLVGCITSASSVPTELVSVRDYIGTHIDYDDPWWKMSNLKLEYANLNNRTRRMTLSTNAYNSLSIELEARLRDFQLTIPQSFQYSTTILDRKLKSTLDSYFHSYPKRNQCMLWNFVRILRILIKESVIKHYSINSVNDECQGLLKEARGVVEGLTREICASVPKYSDCKIATATKLERCHIHTPERQADCYMLIFPLYVVGWSRALPEVKSWAIEQLHYISSHFNIRNAEIVAQMLEQDTRLDPWEVFAMLGSYAFPI